jgi:hypothetical protein
VPDGIEYELLRFRNRAGAHTTVYLTRHPRRSTRVRVVHFPEPTRLDVWCAAEGHAEAIVAGFFVRDPYRPLGELRLGGRGVPSEPVPAPWAERRGCLHADGGELRLAPRGELGAEPAGDLVQAGPLLLRGGEVAAGDGEDPEGFSAGSDQFDSDITAEAHPRCAFAVSEEEVLLACCDGRRTGVDAGLTLPELARLLLSAGATDAINLDGGGSATLVHRGHLLNRPYSTQDQPAPESRPVVTALVLDRR